MPANRLRYMDLGVLVVMLVAASMTWGPVFGDLSGYVAAVGGIAVGVAVAWAGYAARLTPWLTAVFGVACYLLFGGAIALRPVAAAGWLPNSEVLQMLMVQTIKGWKDLLTLTPPAAAFVGPTVLPYLACLVAALICGSLALRASRPEWGVIPVGLVVILGILFGSRQAPLARWIGVTVGLIGLVWCSRVIERRRVVAVSAAEAGEKASRRRRNGAFALAGAGAVAALVFAPALTDSQARYAVRDHVVPPLNVREYPSPLSDFRSYNDQHASETLFSVSGLKKDERVRLATLDVYDGIVYNVSTDPKKGFRRIGPDVSLENPPAKSRPSKLSISVGKYSGVWVPGGGLLTHLKFAGDRAKKLQDDLYYSPSEQTALTVTPLRDGDSYRIVDLVRPAPSDRQLEGHAFGAVPMEENTNVPNAVAAKTQKILKGTMSPIQQARAIEQHLKNNGFYAGGEQSPSRPGHRNQRIQAFLEAEYMQGDDEQYAVAMALMARSAGMPARVVMGFYPDSHKDGTINIKGRDAHVWVEINFDGYGWVMFDPTPPRDKKLQTQEPKPKPNPRPIVIQPPDPLDQPVELTPTNQNDDDRKKDEDAGVSRWLFYIATGLGITLLIVGPFVAVLAAKALRTRRRRTKGRPDERAAGAWEDVLDVARDGRVSIDARMTRSEQASAVTDAVAKALSGKKAPAGKKGAAGKKTPAGKAEVDSAPIVETARRADASVFGSGDIGDTSLTATWRSAEEAKSVIRRASTRRSRFSLKSFGARRKSKPPRAGGGRRRKQAKTFKASGPHEQGERGSAGSVYPPKRPNEKEGTHE